MEVFKRQIFLEDSIDRSNDSKNWGKLTATTFYLNVMLTQNMDDMGIFVDMDYIPKTKNSTPVDYTILIDKLNDLGYSFDFMVGSVPQPLPTLFGTEKFTLRLPSSSASTYYAFGNLVITGNTDSKLEDVRSYKGTDPYRINFDVSKETYQNYNNITVIGVDRIKSMQQPRIYVFDTENNPALGTNNQVFGLQYKDYTGTSRTVLIDGKNTSLPVTEFRYIGEGWNQTNTSLSALLKEEYLFGIISPPEVESDVFIDRGITGVMDYHLKLSEIGNLGELSKYGNGYYKLNKQ
jgi:hypothetical protein